MSDSVVVNENAVHVVPVGDIVAHTTETEDCACGPYVHPVERIDGSIGWVITHASLDGREHREPK